MEAIFGQHLFADIIHDFPKFTEPFYNIGGNLRRDPRERGVDYSENATSERLIGLASANPTFKARIDQKIIFTVPKKTSTFQKAEPPLLFPTGNQNVGIVQDAGEYITEFLGAKNVITFGSILDPASKPIGQDKNAIWYDVGPATFVEIPLAEFGFDRAYIESITVGGLRGGGIVSAIFKIGGAQIDAIKMAPFNAASSGVKPINNTKVEVSGYFTSIEGANLRASAKTPAPDLVRFNIGKTLGDVMLVASIMPSFAGGTPNSFLAAGGTWKTFNTDSPTEGPSMLVLKTGDILNHTRAVLKNVPSILERQVSAGRVVKQYEFVPSIADEATIFQSFVASYNKLIADSETAYGILVTSLQQCIEGGLLKVGYSNFSGTGDVIRSVEGRSRAAVLIAEIVRGLNILRRRVSNYYTTRRDTVLALGSAKNIEIRDSYENDVAYFKFLVPPTLEVFDTRKNVMKTKIIVTQVPRSFSPTGAAIPFPSRSSIEINMWNTFSTLDNPASANDGATLVSQILATTDLGKKFFSRIPPEPVEAPAQVVIPAEAISAESNIEIEAKVNKIVEDVQKPIPDANLQSIEKIVGPLGAVEVNNLGDADPINIIDGEREVVGGGIPRRLRLDKDFNQELQTFWTSLDSSTSSIPETMNEFMRYLKRYPYFARKSVLIAFNYVIEVCELGYSSPHFSTVLDVELLESLTSDVQSIRSKFSIDPAPKSWGDTSASTRGAVLLFNAYTCHVNCENAKYFQSADDSLVEENNEIAVYYKTMENQFIEKAATLFRASRGARRTRRTTRRNRTRKQKRKNRARKTNRRQTYV